MHLLLQNKSRYLELQVLSALDQDIPAIYVFAHCPWDHWPHQVLARTLADRSLCCHVASAAWKRLKKPPMSCARPWLLWLAG